MFDCRDLLELISADLIPNANIPIFCRLEYYSILNSSRIPVVTEYICSFVFTSLYVRIIDKLFILSYGVKIVWRFF